MQRALAAARNAHAYIPHPRAFEQRHAAGRVGKVRIAAVDDHVAPIQQRHERVDHLVHRPTGADHQPDHARPFQRLHELLQRIAAADVFMPPRALDKRAHICLRLDVVNRRVNAMTRQIERQILPHDRQSEQADFRLIHDVISFAPDQSAAYAFSIGYAVVLPVSGGRGCTALRTQFSCAVSEKTPPHCV